jgi:hypothetical protein
MRWPTVGVRIRVIVPREALALESPVGRIGIWILALGVAAYALILRGRPTVFGDARGDLARAVQPPENLSV